jgi:hypothetical protein
VAINDSKAGSFGEPTTENLLHLDIDLRLGAGLWREVWTDEERDDEGLGALLWFAYGKGYTDALTEVQRGKICRDHGLTVPRRSRENG